MSTNRAIVLAIAAIVGLLLVGTASAAQPLSTAAETAKKPRKTLRLPLPKGGNATLARVVINVKPTSQRLKRAKKLPKPKLRIKTANRNLVVVAGVKRTPKRTRFVAYLMAVNVIEHVVERSPAGRDRRSVDAKSARFPVHLEAFPGFELEEVFVAETITNLWRNRGPNEGAIKNPERWLEFSGVFGRLNIGKFSNGKKTSKRIGYDTPKLMVSDMFDPTRTERVYWSVNEGTRWFRGCSVGSTTRNPRGFDIEITCDPRYKVGFFNVGLFSPRHAPVQVLSPLLGPLLVVDPLSFVGFLPMASVGFRFGVDYGSPDLIPDDVVLNLEMGVEEDGQEGRREQLGRIYLLDYDLSSESLDMPDYFRRGYLP